MDAPRKFAFALDGLIRSIVRGDGGQDYERKCIDEIAEAIEELTGEKAENYLGRRVEVIFDYDFDFRYFGNIVYDVDRTIIRLDNGRYVLGTDCQWRPFG